MIPAGAAALDMVEYQEPDGRAGERRVIHTLSVLVEDKPGALVRVCQLFARRGFNIESLAVGPTERPDVSCITLRVNCDQQPLEQIEKQMHKLVNVLRVRELEPGESVERELALITIAAPPERRAELMALDRRLQRAGRRRRPRDASSSRSSASRRSSTPSRSSSARTASASSPAPAASASRARHRAASHVFSESTSRKGASMATIHRERRPRPPPGQGRGRRLRQPGSRARPQPARLRSRGRGRAPRGQRLVGRGRGGRSLRRDRRRRGARRPGRLDAPPRPGAAGRLRRATSPRTSADGAAVLFAHGFNVHYGRIAAAGRPRRDHGRPEGPRAHRPAPLHRGVRDAGARRGRAGRERRGAPAGARVRRGDRRDPRGRDRDDVRRGDRERPVRRAGRPLRRRHRADPARLRDARRGGLPARDRLLRVPPRAEADRRPDLRGRARRDALLDLGHGRVRRPHAAGRR